MTEASREDGLRWRKHLREVDDTSNFTGVHSGSRTECDVTSTSFSAIRSQGTAEAVHVV